MKLSIYSINVKINLLVLLRVSLYAFFSVIFYYTIDLLENFSLGSSSGLFIISLMIYLTFYKNFCKSSLKVLFISYFFMFFVYHSSKNTPDNDLLFLISLTITTIIYSIIFNENIKKTAIIFILGINFIVSYLLLNGGQISNHIIALFCLYCFFGELIIRQYHLIKKNKITLLNISDSINIFCIYIMLFVSIFLISYFFKSFGLVRSFFFDSNFIRLDLKSKLKELFKLKFI